MNLQMKEVHKIEQQNYKISQNMLYNALLIIGIIVAVIVGAILGIKFMMGSVGEKADDKEIISSICCWMHNCIWSIWDLEISGNYFSQHVEKEN